MTFIVGSNPIWKFLSKLPIYLGIRLFEISKSFLSNNGDLCLDVMLYCGLESICAHYCSQDYGKCLHLCGFVLTCFCILCDVKSASSMDRH